MEERVEQRGVEFRVVMEYVLVCEARHKLMRGGLVKNCTVVARALL